MDFLNYFFKINLDFEEHFLRINFDLFKNMTFFKHVFSRDLQGCYGIFFGIIVLRTWIFKDIFQGPTKHYTFKKKNKDQL